MCTFVAGFNIVILSKNLCLAKVEVCECNSLALYFKFSCHPFNTFHTFYPVQSLLRSWSCDAYGGRRFGRAVAFAAQHNGQHGSIMAVPWPSRPYLELSRDRRCLTSPNAKAKRLVLSSSEVISSMPHLPQKSQVS